MILRFTLHPDARPLDDAIRDAEAIIQAHESEHGSGVPAMKLQRRAVSEDGITVRIEWWEDK